MLGNRCFNFTRHWTLNFYKFPTFSDTIRASTEPCMNRVRDETQFMDDFTMSLFIENTSLIFVFFTMSCGFIAHKTRRYTTLLSKKVVGGFILIYTDGCCCVTGCQEISTKSKPLFTLLSCVFPLNQGFDIGMHINVLSLVIFKLFKERSSSQLFGLLFTFGLPPTTKLTINIGINVENTFVMTHNTIFWQRYIHNLTVLHEVIFEVVINHDSIQINILRVIIDSKNELFRVKETKIHVDGADESFKNIFQNLWIIIPPVSLSLLIHENHVVETQFEGYSGEGL